MISKFRAHAQRGLDKYNFLVSRRPDVILAENILQKPEATTIWMDFAMISIQATQLDLKIEHAKIINAEFMKQSHPATQFFLDVRAPQGIDIA